MKNDNNIWVVVGITIVIAIVVSLLTIGITGNVIKVRPSVIGGQEVYTKVEVDKKIIATLASCKTTTNYFISPGSPLSGDDLCIQESNNCVTGFLTLTASDGRSINSLIDCGKIIDESFTQNGKFSPYLSVLCCKI